MDPDGAHGPHARWEASSGGPTVGACLRMISTSQTFDGPACGPSIHSDGDGVLCSWGSADQWCWLARSSHAHRWRSMKTPHRERDALGSARRRASSL